eukprot:g30903.t1
MEHCVQFEFLCLRQDITAIEKVQQTFTRLIPRIVRLSFEDRFKRLGLYSMEFRRMRGNVIETYKTLKDVDRMDTERLFSLAKGLKPGDNLRIKGYSFEPEMRKNIFISEC